MVNAAGICRQKIVIVHNLVCKSIFIWRIVVYCNSNSVCLEKEKLFIFC